MQPSESAIGVHSDCNLAVDASQVAPAQHDQIASDANYYMPLVPDGLVLTVRVRGEARATGFGSIQ